MPDTLVGAGLEHAAELFALTPDDYVNSLIVTAAQRVPTSARVLVQVEEPGLVEEREAEAHGLERVREEELGDRGGAVAEVGPGGPHADEGGDE